MLLAKLALQWWAMAMDVEKGVLEDADGDARRGGFTIAWSVFLILCVCFPGSS